MMNFALGVISRFSEFSEFLFETGRKTLSGSKNNYSGGLELQYKQ